MVVVTGTNNEHVLVRKVEDAYDVTISNTASALKGTALSLTDPNTASTSVGAGAVMLGILQRDKVASDGRTQVPVYKRGIFRAVCSGAVILGHPLIMAGVDNMIKSATTGSAVSGCAVIGYSLETGADQEEIEYQLMLA